MQAVATRDRGPWEVAVLGCVDQPDRLARLEDAAWEPLTPSERDALAQRLELPGAVA